jgi:hypothetical protein
MRVAVDGGVGNGKYLRYAALGANYARAIGVITFKWTTLNSTNCAAQVVVLQDGTATQLTLGVNSAGNLVLLRGDFNATVIATSTESILSGSVVSIAYDLTAHNSAGVSKVWLNGVAVANLTLTGQDLCSTANNYFNGFGFGAGGGNTTSVVYYIDHSWAGFYLASGGAEVPPLTSPLIETQVGSADNTRQFSVGAGTLGEIEHLTTTTNAPGAGQLALRKFTPAAGCTLASVGIVPGATSAAAKFKAVLYSDSAGAPNASSRPEPKSSAASAERPLFCRSRPARRSPEGRPTGSATSPTHPS